MPGPLCLFSQFCSLGWLGSFSLLGWLVRYVGVPLSAGRFGVSVVKKRTKKIRVIRVIPACRQAGVVGLSGIWNLNSHSDALIL
jgi:hypothetical protein